jgi:hypothetical protein
MTTRLAALVVIGWLGVVLGGCGEVGMCSKTSLGSEESPNGAYSVEMVTAECVAASKANWIILEKTSGWLRERKIVAIVDATGANADKLKARWMSDRVLYVRTRGAPVWSFQPYWRDVEIEDK